MSKTRMLRDTDLDALIAIRTVSFPGSGLPADELRRIFSERLPFTRGLFIDGELACVATMHSLPMYLAGKKVEMGGLAGVASAPERRRQGFVRELLAFELAELKAKGVGWCLEYPFDPRFYHRLGWQSLPAGVELQLPARYLLSGPPPDARNLPLEAFPDLAPVYDAWARRYNFALTRRGDSRGGFRRLVSRPWLEDDTFLYELEGAYVLFRLEQESSELVLRVEDYAYGDATARASLLRFLGSFEGQAAVVRIFLPDDDPLTLDHRARHALAKRWPVQARIVDLVPALEPLSCLESGRVSVAVSDPLCPWNDGVFDVSSGPEGCNVTVSDSTPQAQLPIQTVTLLLAGAVSPAAALAHGLAQGSEEALALLASLGGSRPSFMPLSDAF